MPKRNRVRARARRPIETTIRTAREDEPRGERTTARRRSQPAGPVRATDEASPVLARAAAAEHSYVMKDARRLGLVSVIMFALLAASGFVVDRLL